MSITKLQRIENAIRGLTRLADLKGDLAWSDASGHSVELLLRDRTGASVVIAHAGDLDELSSHIEGMKHLAYLLKHQEAVLR